MSTSGINYIAFDGKADSIVPRLQRDLDLDESVVHMLLQNLPMFQYLLDDDEEARTDEISGSSGDSAADGNKISLNLSIKYQDRVYHVSMKRITLFIIAWYIDAKINIPLASLATALFGVDGMKLVNIQESNGELCVFIEEKLHKGSVASFELFSNGRSECVNNNLKCRLNQDGKCTLTRDEFTKILTTLKDGGVMRLENNRYIVNF